MGAGEVFQRYAPNPHMLHCPVGGRPYASGHGATPPGSVTKAKTHAFRASGFNASSICFLCARSLARYKVRALVRSQVEVQFLRFTSRTKADISSSLVKFEIRSETALSSSSEKCCRTAAICSAVSSSKSPLTALIRATHSARLPGRGAFTMIYPIADDTTRFE